MFTTSPRACSEGKNHHNLHPPPISIGHSPTHEPSNAPPKDHAKAEIAHAIGVPDASSHRLTPNALRHLRFEDAIAELRAGYTRSVMDQWALRRVRIVAWITSGALDGGVDGDGRALIVSRPSFWGEEMLRAGWPWGGESAEAYEGSRPERWRRTMGWVQGVEGGVGSVRSARTLEDEVYNFCGDEEEILHRSVSEPERDEEGSSQDPRRPAPKNIPPSTQPGPSTTYPAADNPRICNNLLPPSHADIPPRLDSDITHTLPHLLMRPALSPRNIVRASNDKIPDAHRAMGKKIVAGTPSSPLERFPEKIERGRTRWSRHDQERAKKRDDYDRAGESQAVHVLIEGVKYKEG
ncbi:hypothetical protein DSL72_002140 [Monilinia vaccinii-corymbosi]|uniref:Uncharacterized protein n=1 Tax=Monilinia vaccinii-corymbosi TaxID=61207 RepID=A0A8A3PBS1_9HELO|nr:hypothetical protein DSL72_002140 [Monilinia vaccinii-corymbosi]